MSTNDTRYDYITGDGKTVTQDTQTVNPPTLEDVAEIVRPHNEQLLKDLRMRLFYERVREITRNIERNKISYIATAIALRSALKDVER